MLEIMQINKRFSGNQTPQTIQIKINKYEKLSDLKQLINKKFWLDTKKIKLLSKGKFLEEDDKTLFDLKVENNQTIMILEKNLKEEQEYEKIKEIENLKILKQIFLNFNQQFLLFSLKQNKMNVEESIVQLSDVIQLKQLQSQYEKLEDQDQNELGEKNIKIQIMNKLSSEQFFILLFKLEQLENEDIKLLIWKIIKCLPPNYQLVQNIKKYIKNINKEVSDQIIHTLNNIEIKSVQQKQPKQSIQNSFNFCLQELFIQKKTLDIYKLDVFLKQISIFQSKEEETKNETKFKLQKNFIKKQGIKLLCDIFICLIEKLEQTQHSKDIFELKVASLLAQTLKGYMIANLLIQLPDSLKMSKKIFGRKIWMKSFKKDDPADNSIRRNYSTDNIFFDQQQNVSFKTNKSPKSILTPNFQSPNVSRSISAQSYSNPQKSNLQDKDDISFSVFTNTSKENYQLDFINQFIKKLLKENEIAKELNKNFENSKIFNKLFGFLEYHLINLQPNLQDTTEILFDTILKIFTINGNMKKDFTDKFFFLLFERIDDYQISQKETFNDVLFKFFCEIMYSENMINNLDTTLYNSLMSKLIQIILEETNKSFNVFLIFKKLFQIYIEKNQDSLIEFFNSKFPDLSNNLILKIIYKLTIGNDELINLGGFLILFKLFLDFKLLIIPDDIQEPLLIISDLVLRSLFQINFDSSFSPQIINERDRKYSLFVLLSIAQTDKDSLLTYLNYLSQLYTKEFKSISVYQPFQLRQNNNFIGMKNMKNICYLNSIIQQLFFIDGFREKILGTDIQKNNQMSNEIFIELKHLFAQLKGSIFQSIVPTQFCLKFKAFDGNPINNYQQQDANEFLSLLLDQIEMEYKQNNQNIVENNFKGVLNCNISSMEEDYNFEKIIHEPFLNICLNIKNNKNLSSALDQYTKGSILEGDNKYFCDKFNKKIKVIKKYEFKKLPDTLIFTLNRFEYDPVLGQRTKLNGYFEFPFELNLDKWCLNSKHIEQQFRTEIQENEEIVDIELKTESTLITSKQNENLKKVKKDIIFTEKDDIIELKENSIIEKNINKNEEEYNYKLVGVVVHSGIAQSGHYYSYIYKDKKWFEFNDTRIKQVKLTSVSQKENYF